MNTPRSIKVILCLAMLGAAAAAHASPTQVIQPDEPAAKDAFAYQFLATTDMNVDFYAVLPAVNTGSASQHSQQSFIEFDLSDVHLPAAKVASATLGLYEIPSELTGFGASPTAAHSIEVSVHRATSGWPETLTWNSRPTFDATATDIRTLDGSQINNWVSYDVRSLVQQWLSDPAGNFGVSIVSDHDVRDEMQTAVIGVFSSSSTDNKPKLTLTFNATAGDADLNDVVDVNDLSVLAANWQRVGDATWATGDFDGDHNVTEMDLGLLSLNWQSGGGPGFAAAGESLGLPTAVPEQAGALGLVEAIVILARRERKVTR